MEITIFENPKFSLSLVCDHVVGNILRGDDLMTFRREIYMNSFSFSTPFSVPIFDLSFLIINISP